MKNLNKNELALFTADIIKGIKNYNYDVFYDIIKINEAIKETDKDNTEKTLNWYIRENGTWLVEASDLDFNSSVKFSFEHTNIYKLTFYKEDYKNNFAVVTIETIK